MVQRLLAIATLLREREAAANTKGGTGKGKGQGSPAPLDDEAMATKPDVPVGLV